MVIETNSNKKLSGYLKLILILFGVLIVSTNLFTGSYLNVFVGIFIIYLSTFEKNIAISNEGVIITLSAFKMKSVQLIPFEEITILQIEQQGHKEFIHFIKNNIGRKIEVDKAQIPQIKKWAHEKNKNIILC